MEKLNYFGTTLTQAGHYFAILKGESIYRMDRNLEMAWPFNPEGLVREWQKKGSVNRIEVNGIKIIAISGSPIDERGGCKSVFWADHSTKCSFEELEQAIKTLPIAKKIIDQMPFEVKW